MSGLITNSTKNNERDVKTHCTCTSRGAGNKALGDSRPNIKFSLSLCNANRREDVAVQQKSQGLYPKHPSNLLFLLQTLSINFVRKNLREIVREDLIAKSGKVLSLQIPRLYVSSYFLALNNDVKSNIMKLQRVEFDRPGERSPE